MHINGECKFCGKPLTDMNDMQQLIVVPIIADVVPTRIELCTNCLQSEILNRLPMELRPDQQPEIKPPINPAEDMSNPYRSFIGMELRKFLSTPLYLECINVVFYNMERVEIGDFTLWLDRSVVLIENADNDSLAVTLSHY